jgi:hypothetical protein
VHSVLYFVDQRMAYLGVWSAERDFLFLNLYSKAMGGWYIDKQQQFSGHKLLTRHAV